MDYIKYRIRHTKLFRFATRGVGEWNSLGRKKRRNVIQIMGVHFFVVSVQTRLDIAKLSNLRICRTIFGLAHPIRVGILYDKQMHGEVQQSEKPPTMDAFYTLVQPVN